MSITQDQLVAPFSVRRQLTPDGTASTRSQAVVEIARRALGRSSGTVETSPKSGPTWVLRKTRRSWPGYAAVYAAAEARETDGRLSFADPVDAPPEPEEQAVSTDAVATSTAARRARLTTGSRGRAARRPGSTPSRHPGGAR